MEGHVQRNLQAKTAKSIHVLIVGGLLNDKVNRSLDNQTLDVIRAFLALHGEPILSPADNRMTRARG
jgi:hypothetical protein